MEQVIKEKILSEFKEEISLGLKIVFGIVLVICGFLFGRIYENGNILKGNFSDNYTFIEVQKISDEGIEGKINFGSLKILKDGKNFSFGVGKFFLKN
ncbi:hypothetical protein LR002_01760 [Candidatus Gracilibacteria bacterium]|nr:hypothetical protein [Candidatus Gracilibacteria bacterium]